MQYLVINREGINDAINGRLNHETNTCPKTKIFDAVIGIKPDEIVLIWEDTLLNSPPLWVVSDKVYLETLAYIDTYVKKYTPFTAFYRVISHSSFIKEKQIKRNTSYVNTDVLIGVVIAEAHLKYDSAFERENSLPIQAYLSTLSATIVCAVNSGYSVDKIPAIVKNWEATKSLLKIEENEDRIIELLNFWIPVLYTLSNNKKKASSIKVDDYLPSNVQRFLSAYQKKGKITDYEWSILIGNNKKLLGTYASFTNAREEGIESFKELLDTIYREKDFSSVEIEVIISASLSILASGTMDYLSLAFSLSEKNSLVAHWYMLFTGMHKKGQIFSTVHSVGNHIKKHLTNNNTLFSKVTTDISYPELKVVLKNQINILPFVTAYSTVIDVEIYPLVKAKYRIKRNSNVVHNETRKGVFLTNKEFYEINNALIKATKLLNKKSSTPKQRSLFK